MVDILDIEGEPVFDDRIVRIENHTYNPYANTTFGYNDEIRIPIQQQDLYTLPCQSFLYIEGRLAEAAIASSTERPVTMIRMANNCIAFLFDEIRYELNGVEVDRNRNVGVTTTIKNYISLSSDESEKLKNAGWDPNNERPVTVGDFNFCVPLGMLLGFCEDYRRIVINARHELVLIRSRNDRNSSNGREGEGDPVVTLLKIQWRMPHIVLNDVEKLTLLRTLDSGRYLSIGFRSWDLYEFPLLQRTTKHSWAVKAATQLEKPRYVILALQHGRKNVTHADASRFDDCKLTNVKLYLNSDFYPYDDMNLDFANRKFAVLYDMYVRFRGSYYGRENDESAILTLETFLEMGPLVVIDCSHQNESVKSATVDVRVEFECRENVPADTTAYCLILHDRVVEYSPLTNVVRRIV